RRPVRADRLSGEWRRAAWRLDARQYHYPQLIVHIGGIWRSNTCSPIFCRGLGQKTSVLPISGHPSGSELRSTLKGRDAMATFRIIAVMLAVAGSVVLAHA